MQLTREEKLKGLLIGCGWTQIRIIRIFLFKNKRNLPVYHIQYFLKYFLNKNFIISFLDFSSWFKISQNNRILKAFTNKLPLKWNVFIVGIVLIYYLFRKILPLAAHLIIIIYNFLENKFFVMPE